MDDLSLQKQGLSSPYVDKPRRFVVAHVTGPFDSGKAFIESQEGGKFRVPSAHIAQLAREERGPEEDIFKNGHWVKEGVLYRKGSPDVLLPTGLPYMHPVEATKAHKSGKEYCLEDATQEGIDKAVAEGLEIKASDLDESGNLVIPCSRFGDNEYALILFGGKGDDAAKSARAREAGFWIKDARTKPQAITIYLDGKPYTSQVGNHANQLWFYGVDHDSDFRGDGRDLTYDYRVLGVSDSAEGAGAEK